MSWIARLWVELQLLVQAGSAFHCVLLPFVAVHQMQAFFCQDNKRDLQLEPLSGQNAAVLTHEILQIQDESSNRNAGSKAIVDQFAVKAGPSFRK